MTTNTITALRGIFTTQETYPENLSDRQVAALQNISDFLNWLDDPKPEFSPGGYDKFAALIRLSCRTASFSKAFFLWQFGTPVVARWAKEDSRPDKRAGQAVIDEIKPALAQSLIDEASAAGLYAYAHHAAAFYEKPLPGSFLAPGEGW